MNERRALTTLPLVLLCTMLAGCGEKAPDDQSTELTRLKTNLAKSLPKGWQVGTAKDSGVAFVPPTKPDDILVWKTDKVLLRRRAAETVGAEPQPVHIYFTLAPQPFISPEAYSTIYASNNAIKAEHDLLEKRVGHIPRNKDGEFLTRGGTDSETVGSYKARKKELPPYQVDLPDYYFGQLAFCLRDWRKIQEPEERLPQTEMNTAYYAITKLLTQYKR
jgi:hypothetical protein